jgi:hypothetical protein
VEERGIKRFFLPDTHLDADELKAQTSGDSLAAMFDEGAAPAIDDNAL